MTLVTYAFTAHVSSVDADPLLDAPTAGDLVTGTLVYDPDPSHYAPGATQFAQKSPGSGLFIQVDRWTFVPQPNPDTALLIVGADAASFNVFSSTETWVEGNMPNCYASFQLQDPSATMFAGLSLPETVDVTNLTQSSGGGLIFKTFGTPHFEIDATIDTFARR